MPAKMPEKWDREVDVVVLGSGAAALVAATLAHDGGAKVLLLEKAPMFGGTTAVSGGMPWVPANKFQRASGVTDSREEALMYVRRLTHGRVPDESLVELYMDTAPEMIDYLEAHTPAKFYNPDWFDYYSMMPGWKKGRSLDNKPFEAGKQLGPWAEKLRRSHTFPPLTVGEGALGGKIDYELLGKRYEEDIRTMGSALVAALFKGLLDRGIETLNETRAKELVMNEAGEVIGVVAEREGKPFYAGARKGVMLGTGGFEWNTQLMKAFLPSVITHPLTPPYNEGDGLLMAMDAGALLGNMTEAWWQVAATDPNIEYDGRILNTSAPRGMPSSFIVNKKGKRFVNESGGYNDVPRVFGQFDPVGMDYPNLPAWTVFDHSVKSSAQLMHVPPDDPAPDWWVQADTIAELAQKLGIPPKNLEETLERWNMYAAEGVDPDFQRGAYQWGYSGAAPKPKPLTTPPFYAIEVFVGAIGTKGGPRINKEGQVLSTKGEPLPGLYAAGNAAAGVFGISYPSGGATIGPALTFGYLAGKSLAKQKSKALASTSKR